MSWMNGNLDKVQNKYKCSCGAESVPKSNRYERNIKNMNKYRYLITASNNQGASTEGNDRRFLTSFKNAIQVARQEFGSGWKISIMRYGIDGDGHSIMYPPEEVKTFRIR